MRKTHAVMQAAIIGLAMLVPASFAAAAHSHGGHRHFGFRHHRNTFGAWPYGGYVALPYDFGTGASYGVPTQTVIYVPEPPRAITCKKSQQIMTVPSEEGGTRQVTVTRC